MFSECRLLVAELVSLALMVGISEAELVKILIGKTGRVESLRKNGEMTVAIELRVRRLLELCKLLRDVCGDYSERWLRAPNGVLGLRSPIEVLQDFPAALDGFLSIVRIYHSDNQGVTIN